MYSIKKVCTFKNKGHWPLKYVNILYIICISIFLYSTSDSDYPASSNFRHIYICDRICEKGSSTHIQFPNFDNLTFDWKRLLLWNLHCSETKHWLMNRENVSSIIMILDHKVIHFQVSTIQCVWKTPFCKFGHIYYLPAIKSSLLPLILKDKFMPIKLQKLLI